jgi:poly(3-hydroxybutyrate) depolymerase
MIAGFMRNMRHRRCWPILAAAVLILSAGCRKKEAAEQPDRPRLTPSVTLRDVSFRSPALNRDMPYRVIMPVNVAPGAKLPVVYLLHGGGGDFRDWSNYSDVAHYAESGLMLVMPEGGRPTTPTQSIRRKTGMKTTSCGI